MLHLDVWGGWLEQVGRDRVSLTSVLTEVPVVRLSTRKYVLQKEVPFFIKILHLSSPDQAPWLMGCRGYLTKSAVHCCRSSVTGDFCTCLQWGECYRFHHVKRVSSVGDKTKTSLLETVNKKHLWIFFFKPSFVAQLN